MCNFPYPSKSTLNRRISNIDVEPGVLTALLNILKCRTQEMTEPDRLCILSFDECSVAHAWSYDKGTDTLYSPKDRAQCVMIRGLIKPWKQLVFYDFDRNMTKEILFDLIEKIETTGYNVAGMVSDLCPTNVKLWKTLGIGIENCSFRNPAAPDRDVYVCADAPHLIKSIRNNFLDSGFQFPDGRCVLSGCVRELISRSVNELKAAHRLSESHIYVDGFKGMKVSLAAQLLSSPLLSL